MMVALQYTVWLRSEPEFRQGLICYVAASDLALGTASSKGLDMKRKNLGLAIGLCVLAIVALAAGLILQNQANFSRDYLHDQLAEHGITFTPAANLLPQQQKIPCLIANAGKPLLTGKQAECYAKYQIGIDLTLVDGGKTYFQAHYNGYLSRQKYLAAVKANPNDPGNVALLDQANQADQISNDLLAGEATKGLLLTGYGFSVMGDRLAQTAVAAFIIAGLLLVAGIALLTRALRKTAAPANSDVSGQSA